MLAILLSIAAGTPERTTPVAGYVTCIRAEVTKLAANTATPAANADTAVATCEPALKAAAAALDDEARSSQHGQRATLNSGQPMPDLAAAIMPKMRETLRAMAVEGITRLRAGQPLAGVKGTAQVEVRRTHPAPAPAGPAPAAR